MYTRIPTALHAADPISRAGLASELRARPELLLVDETDTATAKVCIVALETWNDECPRTLKALRAKGVDAIVLVINSLSDVDLLSVVESGVCALVWRHEATGSEMARTIVQVASGNGALPPDVLGRLLKRVSRLQQNILAPMGIKLIGLSAREAEVLGMLAGGETTREIASTLCYSERTVTNILHDITSRFRLKNRTHAVAYAISEGLIAWPAKV